MVKMRSWALVTLGVAALGCGASQSTAVQPAPELATASVPETTAARETTAAPATVAAPADSNVEAATAAAQSWLALVDAGKYSESWGAAATTFKSGVTQEKWDSSVSGVRGPLGKLVSRQVKSAEFKTALPGAPDGKYVVIQFSTTFANKAAAVETVTPMQESDATWKVSGYFIK